MDTDLSPEQIRMIVTGMVVLDPVDRGPRVRPRVRRGPARRSAAAAAGPRHAQPARPRRSDRHAAAAARCSWCSRAALGFGWGKPVEHTTARSQAAGVYISFAGPAMNLMLGTRDRDPARGAARPPTWSRSGSPLSDALGYAVVLNFILFFFNLIPAPPLDGGSVAARPIPRSWLDGWDKFAVYGPFLLMALIMIPPLGRIFSWPARMVASKLYVVLAHGVRTRDERAPTTRSPSTSSRARSISCFTWSRSTSSPSSTSRSRSSPRSTSSTSTR